MRILTETQVENLCQMLDSEDKEMIVLAKNIIARKKAPIPIIRVLYLHMIIIPSLVFLFTFIIVHNSYSGWYTIPCVFTIVVYIMSAMVHLAYLGNLNKKWDSSVSAIDILID